MQKSYFGYCFKRVDSEMFRRKVKYRGGLMDKTTFQKLWIKQYYMEKAIFTGKKKLRKSEKRLLRVRNTKTSKI